MWSYIALMWPYISSKGPFSWPIGNPLTTAKPKVGIQWDIIGIYCQFNGNLLEPQVNHGYGVGSRRRSLGRPGVPGALQSEQRLLVGSARSEWPPPGRRGGRQIGIEQEYVRNLVGTLQEYLYTR